ncbi:MAG: hypothetical protein QG567_439 [Campylobacterota bacterium]|nr:hypothetical protein [Campylobacterota bacterium]MDQ1338724.1 hypothetical protein [Campylobacterota bacterium]MDQ1339287.1 hypothetical protein [Campylobacterota bacterium]
MENRNSLSKKALYLFFTMAFAAPLALEAISTFKGQLLYLKECRVCHLSSKTFLGNYEIEHWDKVFDNDGMKLSDIHLKKDEVFVESKEGIRKSSHKYFKSNEYRHGYEELKAFILESSKNNHKN